MARQYEVISADGHLDVAPDRWTHHVPAKWRERAPRRIKLADGSDGMIIEGRPVTRVSVVPKNPWWNEIMAFDPSPGSGSPEQRIREQDADGVDAEVLYNFLQINFWRGIKEDEGYVAMVHAYNEWLAEEYCSYAPDRLLAMASIPLSNINDAVAELEYSARAGFKGVCLAKFPSGKAVPRPEDDRFWAAALDLGIAITVHAGGRGTRFGSPDDPELRNGPLEASPAGPSTFFRFCGDMTYAPMQMAFAGVFDRFPKLQILWSETNVGWLPYALAQIDENDQRYRVFNQTTLGIEPLERLPSEYLIDNTYWSFLNDRYGIEHRDPRTVDKIMWSSDFPHSATDWPYSRKVIEEVFTGVPEDERHMILAGNAVQFFHLNAG